jgi:amino acid transporter
MASAWATLLAYLAQMIISFYLGKKYYPIPYDVRKFYLYVGSAVGIYCLFSLIRMGMNVPLKGFNGLLIFLGNLMVLGFVYLVYKNERALLRINKR